MSAEDVWNHVDEWYKQGVDFQVVVKRWSLPKSHWNLGEGCQRWNVYAHIYPKHRLWDSFEGTDMFQSAASALPLHCGPTSLKYNTKTGKVESLQVGADYWHLGDERFTNYETREDAWEVFQDAEELFTYLSTNPEDTNTEKEEQ